MIFVDTGPLLARYLPSDQHHQEAEGCWRELTARGETFGTTNLVVGEFLTLLARRASPAFAVERGRRLYASAAWTIVRPEETEETQALVLLERHGAQGAGFVDCVSFAVVRSRGFRAAFTFDSHFRDAGFEILPKASPTPPVPRLPNANDPRPLHRPPRRRPQGPHAVRHRGRSGSRLHRRGAEGGGRPRRRALRGGHPVF